MKIAIGQTQPLLFDFAHNTQQCLSQIQNAHAQGCDLVLLPELCLIGYNVLDALTHPEMFRQEQAHLQTLLCSMPDNIAAIMGVLRANPTSHPPYQKKYLNSACILQKDKPLRFFDKKLLPVHGLFYENRHIQAAPLLPPNVWHFKSKTFWVCVCEDLWGHTAHLSHLKRMFAKTDFNPQEIDAVLSINASPLEEDKPQQRMRAAQKAALFFDAPIYYANAASGQGEVIFDGHSFVLSSKGQLLALAKGFESDTIVQDLSPVPSVRKTKPATPPSITAATQFKALCMGLRHFAKHAGFSKAHLGVSGGVDSAVVANIATHALGASNVTACALPGPYSAEQSLALARQLCHSLNLKLHILPVTDLYEHTLSALSKLRPKKLNSVSQENLQSRLRMLYLMTIANEEHSLLLNTSNKSELGVGYSTLYGDSAGAVCVIGDLFKTQVYQVAKWLHKQGLVPQEIITRPPTAELRPNQKDTDTLPEYDVLDPILKKLLLGQKAQGELEERVFKLLRASEFKRWQGPPVLTLSAHGLGLSRCTL